LSSLCWDGTVAEAMRPVIEVEHLRKRYGSTLAVEDVSFEVQEGDILGIIGPNGAGKTTTVECMEGLRSPDAGRVRVLGLDPQRNPRELRRRIGCQLLESALPDRIRVREALDLFASVVAGEADPRTLMSRWELDGRASTSFGALSGGQQHTYSWRWPS
jgi:ABC-2 type transport system ATP-binding protein